MRRCWVNFQCRGVLLIWITVGQGPTALAVGAGGGCLDIFTLVYHFSFLISFSLSLWETARYRLKYCLKGPLSQKQPTNQPTNHRACNKKCCTHDSYNPKWPVWTSTICSRLHKASQNVVEPLKDGFLTLLCNDKCNSGDFLL